MELTEAVKVAVIKDLINKYEIRYKKKSVSME